MSDQYQPGRSGPAITSSSNERIRYVKSLYRTATRKRERLFIVEGVRLIEEALGAGAKPELVLVDEGQLTRTPRGADLLTRLREFDLWTVSEDVLNGITDTITPQGALALFRIPENPKHPELGAVTLILDGIRDPGNAGSILRSADASGVVRTVAFVDSVDAYSPKVVRAAVGAHFRLTILEDTRLADVQALLPDRPTYLAEVGGKISYTEIDWSQNCALILGGEAEGAGEEAATASTSTVRIPMSGPAESLNAAMAGAVILFEAARVRRAAGALPEVERVPRPRERPERPHGYDQFERRREGPGRPGSPDRPRFGDEGFPQRDNRPFEPRGERRPYEPRGEVRPFDTRRDQPRRDEPWREGRPFPRRDEGRPFEPRDDDRPFDSGDSRAFRPREDSRPYSPRNDRRTDEPRDDRGAYRGSPDQGRPYRQRDDGEGFRGESGGRPYPPRSEERPYAPREGWRPYPPRGEGRPYPPRGEDRPFPPRDREGPYPPRGEGRPFPPRGEGNPLPPRGEGRPPGGGFRDSGKPRWGDRSDERGPRRPPRDDSTPRPDGFKSKAPRRPVEGGGNFKKPRPRS